MQIAAAMVVAVAIYRASGPRGGEVDETVSSEPLFHRTRPAAASAHPVVAGLHVDDARQAQPRAGR